MSNPTFLVLGAILAALIAGFFSYVNLISAKENKVSEFRLAWIDGLREEIASYTAAVQDLARVEKIRNDWTDSDFATQSIEERDIKWLTDTRDSYLSVVSALTRIQLRLNPKHILERPNGHEAKLMSALEEARNAFNTGEFDAAIAASANIRAAAAPLLKSTWDSVKNGELRYRRIRNTAHQVITTGFVFLLLTALLLFVLQAIPRPA